MFARTVGVLALFCSLSPQVRAQDPSEVDQRILEMRRNMEDGKRVVRSHVRVTIRLRNGNRLQGIVKDGTLIERVDGLRFVAAEKEEEGAGIRLYYWNGKNSFVFLPFADMKEYKVKARLTSEQLAEIEKEVRERAEAERLAAERTRNEKNPPGDGAGKEAGGKPNATDPAQPAPAGESAPEEGAGGKPQGGKPQSEQKPAGGAEEETGIGLSEEQQRLFALLQEYPPSAGWNQARRDEISRRRAVVGANPSESEQRFVKVFAEWERACTMFGVKPEPAPKPQEKNDRSGRKSR